MTITEKLTIIIPKEKTDNYGERKLTVIIPKEKNDNYYPQREK